MHATKVEGVEFFAYQLKTLAYQWYNEWEKLMVIMLVLPRGMIFHSVFMDRFFLQVLREDKVEEFVKLNQGRMIVKEYDLKFHQLS